MADFRHKCTTEDEGMEVKDVMKKYFDFSSRLRNRIKREDLLRLNDEHTQGWHRVKSGDVLSVVLPDEKSNFEPQNIPLNIVYEDEDIILINKQPGLIVHPTKGHPNGTVANALMYRMQETGDEFKIRFVNRLDMDTSGLLIVARNSYSQNDITSQMRKNMVHKKYIAILNGIIEEDEGVVDAPIGRPDPVDVRRGVMPDGAPSVTHYSVLERFRDSRYRSRTDAGFTLVELVLETGRTHQIRVHMSHIGHPVLGDYLYGGDNVLLIERQALHAAELDFSHPISKAPVHADAELPSDMQEALDKLRG